MKLIETALRIAQSYVNTVENNDDNRGEVIDKIQARFGLKGTEYCAMFALNAYQMALDVVTNCDLKLPIWTASSQTLAEWAINHKFAYTDPNKLQPGDLAIWRKFKLWKGHVAIVDFPLYDPDKNGIVTAFRTIEGNVRPDGGGRQGIWNKVRFCKKIDFQQDAFYLRCFVDMRALLLSIKGITNESV